MARGAGRLIGVALALARPLDHRLAALPAYGLAGGLLSTGSRAALLAVAVALVVLSRRAGLRRTVGAVLPVGAGALLGR